MPNYTITIAAEDIHELHQRMQDLLPQTTTTSPLDTMSLQELLLYTDQRCVTEGYEMEVRKPQATTRKEEARAKLRGDLEGSLIQTGTTETKVVEEDTPTPKKASKKNGKTASDADQKASAIKQLQQLYADGRKSDVNRILAEYGDGAKNFNVIPEDSFGPILAAIEALA